jgi:hypothetical protein
MQDTPWLARASLLAPLALQVKMVAAPPKPKDMSSQMAQGLFIDYSKLAKITYTMVE